MNIHDIIEDSYWYYSQRNKKQWEEMAKTMRFEFDIGEAN